jgi:hypothetical protein
LILATGSGMVTVVTPAGMVNVNRLATRLLLGQTPGTDHF